MRSYFTNIMSTSSVHTASPDSSSWVAVLPNQPRPRNTLRTRTERSSRSIWSNSPAQVLLETSSWRPLARVRASPVPASPTLWASQCRPRNGRTRDGRHPPSNKTWHLLTSSAMGYPSADHAAGRIYPRYTDSTRQLTRTYTYIHTLNGLIVHAVFLLTL